MIRSTVLFALSATAFLWQSTATAKDLVLADQGQSAYRIVVADDASPSTRHAADELQKLLEEISGAKLPIVSAKEPLAEHEIIVGRNAHFDKLGTSVDFATLGREGYVIRTVGDRLVIAGGDLRGNLYGVYGLLEDHLGCRWFAPGVSRIPKRDHLAIGSIDDRQVPVLEYREPFVYECFDGDWCARNRMNSSAGRLDSQHGGKIQFAGGFFCHTFNSLVPPDEYFDKHPEYFALVKGKRLKDHTQLCCTNEDVIGICIDKVRAAMRSQPNAFAFSVSQNDWHNYCECDKCQALAKQEGSQIAPVLQLVNRVAEAVEKEFPDKVVETLAYQWTRQPPKQMRPRPNVVIRLCSIECCFSHPLATCDSPANRKFSEDLQRWAKVADRLWIWDYTTDFSHYLLPFPNYFLLNDNIQFFIQNHVKGIFEEDTYNTPNSEMAALGGYLMAKFLWNPAYDENQAITEFLDGYYGKAAGSIRAYLDLLHDRTQKDNIHVVIWARPDSPHVANDLLVKANALWDAAEAAVAADKDVLRRVQLSRMSVDYAILERACLQAKSDQKIDVPLGPLAAKRLAPFLEHLAASGVTRLSEGRPLNLDEYRKKLTESPGIQP